MDVLESVRLAQAKRDYVKERLPVLQKVATVSSGLNRAIFNPHGGGHVFFNGWDVKLFLTAEAGELNLRDAAGMEVMLHALVTEHDSVRFEFIERPDCADWTFYAQKRIAEGDMELFAWGSGPTHAYAVADAYGRYFAEAS